MSNDRLLADWKALKALGHPYSRQHTYRLITAGTFPKPIKFGDHPGCRSAWLLKDYLNWLDAYRIRN